MKKRTILAYLLIGVVALSLFGCGSTTQQETSAEESTESAETAETDPAAADTATAPKTYADEAYVANLNVDDYVEVADYSEIPVSVESSEVTEDDIQAELDMYLMYAASLEEVTDRDDVREGDTVNIDFEGKKDGVAFDGGTAQGFELEIGSGRFIEGFEEGLIGVKKGETVDLNLRFPDEYMNEELEGQEVVFTVTVNSIQASVEPDLTDEFVEGLNQTDHDGNPIKTVDDMKAYIRHYLEEDAESAYNGQVQQQMIDYLIENSTFKGELPEEMNTRVHDMITNVYSYYAMMYGVDLETFMTQYYGSESGDYEQDIQDAADQYQKQLLIIKSIAEKEGLTMTEEETEKRIEELAETNGVDVETYKNGMDIKALEEDLIGEKVLSFLAEKAKNTVE
ncbi:MAG: trigger factor [Lachnospiraceae bacterium]|nr:trigger factor [Lachnospiraceae bacterium]